MGISIIIPAVDSRSSAELHERHIQVQAEEEAIAVEQLQLDADLAEFRGRRPEDVVLGAAENFRGRQTALMARELRLRYSLRGLDVDIRKELGGRVGDTARSELEATEKRIGRELVKLGFPRPDVSGTGEEVMCAQFIKRHREVASARARVGELASRASSGDFASQNDKAITRLAASISESQTRLATV